jgi:nucleoside-diphosphate-sugar epimerase
MKKVLIVGGCGYIGSALFTKFRTKYSITTVDLEWFGNYINPNNLKSDFDDLDVNFIDEYDVVVLVAANSSVQLCKDLFDTMDNNVVKFMNLVKKIKKQKFIYASSSCVYTTSGKEQKTEADLLEPLDGLTITKTTIDHFMPLTNVEYYGLRFGSVNGWSPNMRLDLMINSMTLNAKDNSEVNIFNGYANRPILSIDDLCSAVETIIDSNEDKRGIYNVASFNDNVENIGTSVSNYIRVPLKDLGNNFTYDFAISSDKFIKNFDFKFTGTVESIVDSILNNPRNNKWQKRIEK